MKCDRITALVAAFALVGVFAVSAHASPISVRVADYDSAGNLVTSAVTVTDAVNPSVTFGSALGNFSVLVATGSSGINPTAAGLAMSMNYGGGIGASSNTLVIEVASSPLTTPSAGSLAVIMSNASPSSGGLGANLVQMISGVTTGGLPVLLATLPLGSVPAANPAGLLGTTTALGTLGPGSSVLMPNPANGVAFTMPADFTFYQRYTFSQFTSTGAGSFSANSTIFSGPEQLPLPTPEPASFAAWGIVGLVGLTIAGRFRKRSSSPA
jgi:hypothetical protein